MCSLSTQVLNATPKAKFLLFLIVWGSMVGAMDMHSLPTSGFDSHTLMWVEFVVSSCCALRVFLLDLQSSSIHKNQQFQFDLDVRVSVDNSACD